MLKRILFLCFTILASCVAGRCWYTAKDGFSVNRIVPRSFPRSASAESAPCSDYLNQPYRYLAKGRQCYAFISEDGLYVLKIPRLDHFRLSLKWRSAPAFFFRGAQNRRKEDRARRSEYVFKSFQIASEEFRESSGILYSHLQRTETLLPHCTLIDSLGRKWTVDPNGLIFVVQQQADLLIPLIIKELKVGCKREAEVLLTSFVDVLEERSRLGIFNKDPSFRKNFGRKNGKSYQIDVGSFYHKKFVDGSKVHLQAFQESMEPVLIWFADNAPELLSFLEKISQEKQCICDSSY